MKRPNATPSTYRQTPFVFIAILLSVFILLFQNCDTPVGFKDRSQSSTTAQYSSGNGDNYQGKPGQYLRILPDQKCGGERAIHSRLQVGVAKATLSTLNPETCTYQDRDINLNELQSSIFNEELMTFELGVFERRETTPDLTSRELMTPELWCRSIKHDSHTEVVVRVAASSDASLANLVSTTKQPNGVASVDRLMSLPVIRKTTDHRITFSANEFALDYDPMDSSRTAQLRATINGRTMTENLICHTGGRLDPVAPIKPLTCPAGYLVVQANTNYSTNPFCISKYEAKKMGPTPVSEPLGLPWTQVSRNRAVLACQSIGASYDLISNTQWQTVAHEIELAPVNWSNQQIGSAGGLSRGHSDNAPSTPLAASTNDDEACSATEQICDSITWHSQRRIFRLSSGDWIWDLAGNADEWVKDDIIQSYGPFLHISQITANPDMDPQASFLFGTKGDYSYLNSAPYGGLGVGYFDNFGGALRRGGGWEFNGTLYGGLFKVYPWDGPDVGFPSVSFRCVYRP